jgi:hypothetical protein
MIDLFKRRGYELCQDDSFEDGVEKVAIYLHERDFGFTHVARQTPTGMWASKLGGWADIEHATLDGLTSESYGAARIIMKRPRS